MQRRTIQTAVAVAAVTFTTAAGFFATSSLLGNSAQTVTLGDGAFFSGSTSFNFGGQDAPDKIYYLYRPEKGWDIALVDTSNPDQPKTLAKFTDLAAVRKYLDQRGGFSPRVWDSTITNITTAAAAHVDRAGLIALLGQDGWKNTGAILQSAANASFNRKPVSPEINKAAVQRFLANTGLKSLD